MHAPDNASSCWQQASIPHYPRLEQNLTVDVAIIGGGMTGITTAYVLKKAGLSVAILEKGSLAEGNTDKTTAHLTYVTDVPLTELKQDFDAGKARSIWEAGRMAIDFIEETVKERSIECGFQRVPGYLYGSLGDASAAQKLAAEARTATELGFPAAYIDSAPIFATPAVRYERVAKFDPRAYLRSLLEAVSGQGSHVFEHTEAVSFDDNPLTVKANGHALSCGHVVMATHVPLIGTSNIAAATLLQSMLALYTSYVIKARIPRPAAPEAVFWEFARPYNYLRVDACDDADENAVIFGGADHKTGQTSSALEPHARLEKQLLATLPQAEIENRWSGQIVETADGLPFIGAANDKQFVATGFSGNGMTFGTVAASMIRRALLREEDPWAELFKLGRANLRAGAWNYLKENLDYPYYMVKDRLQGTPEAAPVDVAPGEGKVLKVDGKRVAVHRGKDGTLSCVSAVCTHMGCIVHWNKVEGTWDCPCHGSRFAPGGKVLAGPAEEPLPRVDVACQSESRVS